MTAGRIAFMLQRDSAVEAAPAGPVAVARRFDSSVVSDDRLDQRQLRRPGLPQLFTQ